MSSNTPSEGSDCTPPSFTFVSQLCNISNEYKCQYCNQVLDLEATTHQSCGSNLCGECIKCLEECPICEKEELVNENSNPISELTRFYLENLLVRCSKCENYVLRGFFKNHTDNKCSSHLEEIDSYYKKKISQAESDHQTKSQVLDQSIKQVESKIEFLSSQVKELEGKVSNVVLMSSREQFSQCVKLDVGGETIHVNNI